MTMSCVWVKGSSEGLGLFHKSERNFERSCFKMVVEGSSLIKYQR